MSAIITMGYGIKSGTILTLGYGDGSISVPCKSIVDKQILEVNSLQEQSSKLLSNKQNVSELEAHEVYNQSELTHDTNQISKINAKKINKSELTNDIEQKSEINKTSSNESELTDEKEQKSKVNSKQSNDSQLKSKVKNKKELNAKHGGC